MNMKVAILGASDNPDRYAYKAFKMLQEYGHTPIPVSPKLEMIENFKVYTQLSDIPEKVDTLTMYVNAGVSTSLREEILKLKPSRVIFNPGSENPALIADLHAAGIKVEQACTLVLLRTRQF